MMSFIKDLGHCKSIRDARNCCLFGQALLLTSLIFLFLNRWTQLLWEERAKAATNLFRPPTKMEEFPNATIWQRISKTKEILKCSSRTACSATPFNAQNRPLSTAKTAICPFYFRWIHQDLKPWMASGITHEMVERGKKFANFRLMIVDGRLFVETYRKAFQSRDLFTIWGFAQLLKLYPGKVPDVDMMFNVDDKPVVFRHLFPRTVPPPVFRYCGTIHTFDIPFPDWSFWGWPEVGIPAWEVVMKEIAEANHEMKWEDREPTAYWRGNPRVCSKRRDLLKCQDKPNWKGQIFLQNWRTEQKRGFQDSKLSQQCKNRYKIYIEGNAWSVSLKYILACDSTTLMVDTPFIDFFIRGLMPFHDYWPIRTSHMCSDINFAVNWGDVNPTKAEDIGRVGAEFAIKQLNMSYVYSYMLHMLNEYSRLLKYKPKVTEKASDYCSETIQCFASQSEREIMNGSLVTESSPEPPCFLPHNDSSDSSSIANFLLRKQQAINHVLSL